MNVNVRCLSNLRCLANTSNTSCVLQVAKGRHQQAIWLTQMNLHCNASVRNGAGKPAPTLGSKILLGNVESRKHAQALWWWELRRRAGRKLNVVLCRACIDVVGHDGLVYGSVSIALMILSFRLTKTMLAHQSASIDEVEFRLSGAKRTTVDQACEVLEAFQVLQDCFQMCIAAP